MLAAPVNQLIAASGSTFAGLTAARAISLSICYFA
jgi:hypothetical protein